MTAVNVRNLRKTYRHRGKEYKALKGVSFSVKKGEMYGLLGANGAGKTTTINILAGLLTKDSGKADILGRDVEKHEEWVKDRMNVGSAYTWLTGILTVRQNLKVYGKLYGVKDIDRKIDELLRQFNITNLQHTKVYRLSTGQVIRTILCKTLINNPPVLLLDECTVGLDPEMAQKTRAILKDYQKRQGTTIIFTSHNMLEVETLCDRVGIMHNGKIMVEGTPKQIRKLAKKKTIKIDAIGPMPIARALGKLDLDIIYSKKDTIIFHAPEKLKLPTIINTLVGEKFDIIDMNVRKPTLEDVFIKLSKGEIRGKAK
ncbi:ATP-binding cassette domain-containing protein [Candidatus Woesearchaeota archaeon]|nr:ATP-binding cassette domain-containing protein [Candidatus Woesearchaeota archaeon]